MKHLHLYASLSNISDGAGARIPKMTFFQTLFLKDQGHELEIGGWFDISGAFNHAIWPFHELRLIEI